MPIGSLDGQEWVDTFEILRSNLVDVKSDWEVVARLAATFAGYVGHRVFAEINGERREILLWEDQ